MSRDKRDIAGGTPALPGGAILAPASALYPVIPAKAGIRKAADSAEGAKRRGAKGEGRKKVVEIGDSNPQPRHCERRTLPVELCPHDCGMIALYTAGGGNSKIAPPAFWRGLGVIAPGLGLTSLYSHRSGSRLGVTFDRQLPARADALMLLLSALRIVGDSSVGHLSPHSVRVIVRIALYHINDSKMTNFNFVLRIHQRGNFRKFLDPREICERSNRQRAKPRLRAAHPHPSLLP